MLHALCSTVRISFSQSIHEENFTDHSQTYTIHAHIHRSRFIVIFPWIDHDNCIYVHIQTIRKSIQFRLVYLKYDWSRIIPQCRDRRDASSMKVFVDASLLVPQTSLHMFFSLLLPFFSFLSFPFFFFPRFFSILRSLAWIQWTPYAREEEEVEEEGKEGEEGKEEEKEETPLGRAKSSAHDLFSLSFSFFLISLRFKASTNLLASTSLLIGSICTNDYLQIHFISSKLKLKIVLGLSVQFGYTENWKNNVFPNV